MTALEDLRDWEENGISSVLEKKFEKDMDMDLLIENLKSQLALDGKSSELTKILLEGGDIMGMDTAEFVDTVKDINDAYSNFYAMKDDQSKVDGPCGKKLNIQAIFQGSTSEVMEGQQK